MRLPTWLVVAVVLALTGLISAVVVVGLVRDNIDTTGLAIALGPVISGIILGVLIKGGGAGGPKT